MENNLQPMEGIKETLQILETTIEETVTRRREHKQGKIFNQIRL